jgi:seryl-tRNA synthetase
MIDIKTIRAEPDRVRKAIQDKREKCDLDKIINLDTEWRELLVKLEELKHQRNIVTAEIAQLRKDGQNADNKIVAMKQVADDIKAGDDKRRELEDEINLLMLTVPNLPHFTVPQGFDKEDNVEVKRWGEKPSFTFEPRDHLEIGTNLGIIDFVKGAQIAGSAFPLYLGDGARLERSLINFMLDLHTQKHGYTEVFTPVMANRISLTTTGQIPKLEEDMYLIEKDDLFMIPTAEVPITNIHRDEILEAEQLPIKYTGYTPCFRREAGAYGKDTKGFQRVHQFNKVEMVKFVNPEDSYIELQTLVEDAEEVLQLLNIPYRVMNLCHGELSFSAAKCFDLELWGAGSQKWFEVSSCSNFEDFQARRGNIRFRPSSNEKPRLVHTLNGSGVATPRLMIAIIENYQTVIGSIRIPEVLVPYMGGKTEIIAK